MLPRRVEIYDVFDMPLAALFGGRFFEGDAGIEVFGACFAGGVTVFAFSGLAGHAVAVGSTVPPSLSRAPPLTLTAESGTTIQVSPVWGRSNSIR